MKEVVIKMPDEMYDWFVNGFPDKVDLDELQRLVINGTVLPKSHGRIIDVGQCDRKLFYQQCGGADSLITVKSAFDMLMSLPIIIKEDKAESEG